MSDQEDPETEAILAASRFWVQNVLVPITVVIGVVGNTITVMVLTRRRMRSSTNIYLTGLAIADIIHLLFVLLLSFEHYPNIHDGKYELYWRFRGLMRWFCDAANGISVWLAASFTVERYIAVCHPMKGKAFCTERRAKSVIVVVYIFCILTTASTNFEYQLDLTKTCMKCINTTTPTTSNNGTDNYYNITNHTLMLNIKNPSESITIPSSLDDKCFTQLKQFIIYSCSSEPCIIYIPPLASNVSKDNMNSNKGLEPHPSEVRNSTQLDKNANNSNATDLMLTNTTCCDKNYTMIDEVYTKLGSNETYISIMYWYSWLFFWLIPLTLIATFNSFLVRVVYLSQKIRRQLTNSQESIGHSKEKRITVMLIAVVILFIICHTPTASFLIYANFHKSNSARVQNIKRILGNFFNYLITVNASCNFILYCSFSKKFRGTFKKVFFERTKKKQDVIMLSSTKSKNSEKFNPHKHGIMRRHASEYHTPRNLETQSLTSIPRATSLVIRPIEKAKSSYLSI